MDVLLPDPAHGVFATLLVADGVALELDAHLARLDGSVRELYGVALPAAARSLANDRAQGLALGRLRVTVVPRGTGAPRLEATAVAVEREIVLPGWERALDLAPAAVEGWNGAHKWADRRLLEALDARAAPATAVLVDHERGLLETTRANLFAVGDDGIVRTPPADGSILPGIARARVIGLARRSGLEVREERLTPADLRTAREAFATGSVRGVEAVRSFDGAPLDGPGDVTRALAEALRRSWLAERAGAAA